MVFLSGYYYKIYTYSKKTKSYKSSDFDSLRLHER